MNINELYFVVFITEPNNISPTKEITLNPSSTQPTAMMPKPSTPPQLPSTSPTPMLPSKVQGVTVTRTGSSPALKVSWSAVSGRGITYTVCYSTTSGMQSNPPPGANCSASGITDTSTTLGPLSRGTTYYIWVAAVSSDGQGAYSERQQARTHNGKLQTLSLYL